MTEGVLLLDDNVYIQQDLGGFLKRMGYSVFPASSMEDARKLVLSEQIDFAIIDLKIDYDTEFGGIQVVNYVKKIRPTAKTIVLSAYSLADEITSELQVEIDGYIQKGSSDNYILAVLRKIQELDNRNEAKSCFVIMPYSNSKSCREEDWNEIFNTVIKPAVEESGYHYHCTRSEAFHGSIIEEILDQLNRADLVIADLTDRNPNVFYELGVRHALRDTTILIAQNLDDLPFDLRPYAAQIYDWKVSEERAKFKRRIKEVIHFIETNPDRACSPVRKYLKL